MDGLACANASARSRCTHTPEEAASLLCNGPDEAALDVRAAERHARAASGASRAFRITSFLRGKRVLSAVARCLLRPHARRRLGCALTMNPAALATDTDTATAIAAAAAIAAGAIVAAAIAAAIAIIFAERCSVSSPAASLATNAPVCAVPREPLPTTAEPAPALSPSLVSSSPWPRPHSSVFA
eukprot:3561442-Pleurochrysis_carterae.AAC.1